MQEEGRLERSTRIRIIPESKWTKSEESLFLSDLSRFGLTLNQARIYLFLLGKSSIRASQISKELGLHRVEVYRKLTELMDLGLVDVRIDSPKRYEAIAPDAAIGALLAIEESRMHSLQKFGKELLQSLRTLELARRSVQTNSDSPVYSDSLYKLVTGRERYYHEISKLVRNAKFEVLRILSAGGLIRTFLPEGLYKEYVRAGARGVSMKMITEINSKNRTYAEKLSKVLELRLMENVHLRFTVIDRYHTILSARFDESEMSMKSASDNYLLVSDPKFAEIARFFFEHLWTAAANWQDYRKGRDR